MGEVALLMRGRHSSGGAEPGALVLGVPGAYTAVSTTPSVTTRMPRTLRFMPSYQWGVPPHHLVRGTTTTVIQSQPRAPARTNLPGLPQVPSSLSAHRTPPVREVYATFFLGTDVSTWNLTHCIPAGEHMYI